MNKAWATVGVMLALTSPALGLAVGDKAPTVSAKNQDGKLVDFGSLYGRRPVVVFFFPKSFTGG